MNHFTNQSNGSQAGRMNNGGAIIRRFALFPMMLLMLLLLPAGMVAQKAASSSKYIATYDSESATLTFEKYEGESLPSNSKWVEDGTSVFNEFFDLLRQKTIKHIVLNESFKTFTPTTLSQFFAGLTNLETITGLEYLNTANVTNMTSLFANCRKLTSLDLSHFNTAKVTNMYRMFADCRKLTSLDLSNFNTAKVTDMEFMFRDCSNLKTIYASENFITAAVTYSNSMFASCNSLSGDIDWSDKAVDKTYAKIDGGYFRDKAYDNRPWVKYADGTLTFRCGYKKILGENEYELNSGENRPEWFTHYFETSKVVFEASFANARPTSCYAWFRNFKNLTQIEGIENLNTENVTSMSSMFDSCSGLISLDVTNFNTANVTDMSYMFYCCYKLKEIYVSDKFVTDDVISSVYMFMGCNSLSGDIDWKSVKVSNKTYAKTAGGYFRDKAYDNRPWVKCADGTLTFRCGYKKTWGENEYALNSGENLPAWYTHNNNINLVVFDASFANARPTTCSKWFQGFENLKQIKGIENLNTENVTSMANMFSTCSNLVELDVTHFNTANVTSMANMFGGCTGLTSLDVANFNTANVTSMNSMFFNCNKLKEIYVSDKFVTDAVTDSYLMFSGCAALSGDIDWTSDKATDKTYAKIDGGYFRDKAYDNRPWVKYADGTLTFRCGYKKTLGENEYLLNSGENLPAWNTQRYNITRVVFDASFANARPTTCSKWFKDFIFLQQIEGIENLNTENVTSMAHMFFTCINLAELDVTHFNTANVTSMISMFCGCTGLTSLVVTNFNTENVTNMLSMFSGCSNLAGLDLTHFNTANVTNMYGMFSGCENLAELDLSNFNTDKVTNMKSMFINCSKLKEIYVSDKFVTDAVENSNDMFGSCSSLSGDIDWTSDKADDKTYAKIDGGYFRDKAYYNRPWVKYADGTLTFRCGYKKTLGENEYALNSGENLPKWNTHYDKINLVVFEASFANARPTSCCAWFQAFINLKQIEGIENLNTENVTSMSYMFNGCLNLVELDVTHFNTAKVTNMNGMFNDCSNLTELDVTHFNTAKVTTMNSMFSGCSNLTELDLTHFNTAIVTTMFRMFYACKSLTTIYVSDEFVTTNITNGNGVFSSCSKLKGAIDKYDGNKTDHTYANYKTGYFTKLVGKNGDEKIGAAGKTLATENLLLDDNKDFVAYEPFAAKAASYSRKMKEGTTWATLCLPFEVSLANKNFRAFKLLSADDAAETVELEEIETSIAAGTPVIIKMNEGATLLSFSEANKAIANEVKTAETANSNYQLQGLYTQKVFSKDTDNNCYIVKGEKLMNPAKLLEKTTTKFVGSKPFRAYMEDKSSAPVAGARMFSIRIGDGTTAIKQLEADAADAADGKAEYYDLQGHRLQDLQKGVNIVKRGGKTMKVVIK